MRLITIITAIITLAAQSAYCAKNITGTLLSVAADSSAIVLNTGKLVIDKDAKVMRGQIGKELRSVTVRDLAQGDHVVAVVSQNGKATSVKGFFGVVIGVAEDLKGNQLIFNDKRSVTLADNAQVILGDGTIGKPANIKNGMLVKCRVNPSSAQAWTVFAAMPDKKAPAVKPAAAKAPEAVTPIKPVQQVNTAPNPFKKAPKDEVSTKPKPTQASAVPEPKKISESTSPADKSKSNKAQEKPKILSVTYSAPTPLVSGDILTVDMSGTSGGKATFEIKGLFKPMKLDEIKPGSYHASVEIPMGKSMRGEALIAKLTVDGVCAPAVQASRLVTVEANPKDQPMVMQAIAKKNEPVEVVPPVEPTPAPQVVVPVDKPKPDLPKNPAPVSYANITLTNPPDGANITRAILVRGTAEPESNVLVNITYSNGLSGILKLSGQVASQMVAVGKDGKFRVGPIALEGPLATQGLEFTIKAYYPDRDDHGTAVVKAKGARD